MAKQRSNSWSEEELELLREYYPTNGWEIPELLKTRSKSAIVTAASSLGIKVTDKAVTYGYSTEAIPVCIDDEEYSTFSSACKALHVSVSDVLQLSRERDISHQEALLAWIKEPRLHQKWTKEEDETLKANYPTMGIAVAKLFPTRTEKSIKIRVVRLGLYKKGAYEKWSAAEDTLLRESWATASKEELAVLFPGRTYGACSKRASSLGLFRPSASLASKLISDIVCCTQLPGDLLYLVCKCGQHIIIPIKDADKFTCPEHCNAKSVPNGWAAPYAINTRLNALNRDAIT